MSQPDKSHERFAATYKPLLKFAQVYAYTWHPEFDQEGATTAFFEVLSSELGHDLLKELGLWNPSTEFWLDAHPTKTKQS